MFKRVKHGEECKQAIEQSWKDHWSIALHLSPGQTYEKQSGLDCLVVMRAHQFPCHDASLGGNQNAIERGARGFLLPTFQLMPSTLEQFAERFDFPAPVVPEGQLRLVDVVRHIAQQVSLRHYVAIGVDDVATTKRAANGSPAIRLTRWPAWSVRLGWARRANTTVVPAIN